MKILGNLFIGSSQQFCILKQTTIYHQQKNPSTQFQIFKTEGLTFCYQIILTFPDRTVLLSIVDKTTWGFDLGEPVFI